MKLNEHTQRALAGDISPRVVERPEGYVAWTSTWEGPLRPDYVAAFADLTDNKRVQVRRYQDRLFLEYWKSGSPFVPLPG